MIPLTDPLTSLGNQRLLEKDLAVYEGQVARYGMRSCVALIDIDDFAKFNDRYGREAGDKAIVAIAERLANRSRLGDYVYRVVAEGVIECRLLASGEKLFSGRLEGVSKLASPIATADGRVYFISTGNSYVIKAGPTLEILASSKLPGGGNGSSAAISAGRIFVRDFDFLYCLGK